MSKTFNTRVQSKRATEANWKKATNFTPLSGEIIVYEADTAHQAPRFKVGNGQTNVNDLPFVSAETITTIGNSSYGSGWGESMLNKTYTLDIPVVGETTIGPLTNLNYIKTNGSVSAGATSIDFIISKYSTLVSASVIYELFTMLIENGFNGGILEINGELIPITGLTQRSEGNILNKKYYVTAQVASGYSVINAITSSVAPTNIYIGAAYGEFSGAFGNKPLALGKDSFVEGNLNRTTINGVAAHAEGYLTSAEAIAAHSEGSGTIAAGMGAHAEGGNSKASGDYTHAEGNGTQATNIYAHAEGNSSVASGSSSHAEGNHTTVISPNAHAEGSNTIVGLNTTDANGNPVITGNSGHAEGYSTKAYGDSAHAEGSNSIAAGSNSHSEGSGTKANGSGAHAEGTGTVANGSNAHAEGSNVKASGSASHAGGSGTVSSGSSSFAHGTGAQATGHYSAAYGNQTIAATHNAFVVGKFNEGALASVDANGNVTTAGSDKGAYFVVGNGDSDDKRSDAFRVLPNGVAELPSATISEIDGKGNIAVPTVEWVKDYHSKHGGNGGGSVTGDYVEYKNKTVNGDYTTIYDLDGNNGNAQIPGSWSLGEGYVRLSGLADPVSGIDAISKNYLEGYIRHLGLEDEMVRVVPRDAATDPYAYQYVEESVPYLYGRYGALQADGTYRETEGLIKGSIGGIKVQILEQIAEDCANGVISSTEAEEYSKQVEGSIIPSKYRSMLNPHTLPIRDGNCAIPVGMHTWKEDENGDTIEGTDKLWYGAAAPAGWVKHQVFEGEILPWMHGHTNANDETITGYFTGIEQKADPSYSGIKLQEKNLKAYELVQDGSYDVGFTISANKTQALGSQGEYASTFGGASAALGKRAFASGTNTLAFGKYSHTEGSNTVTLNTSAHAEGAGSTAAGLAAHAEGSKTIAKGQYSHAGGAETIAAGMAAFSMGTGTQATGDFSAAFGNQTKAEAHNQFVVGKFNAVMTEPASEENSALFVVGSGSDNDTRRNALEVYKNGGFKVKAYPSYSDTGYCTEMSIAPGLIYLHDDFGGNVTLSSTGLTEVKSTNQVAISAANEVSIYGGNQIMLDGCGNSNISLGYGIQLSTNGEPIALDPGMATATYKNSEIANMDNLIGCGSTLPSPGDSDAPKFFVLI